MVHQNVPYKKNRKHIAAVIDQFIKAQGVNLLPKFVFVSVFPSSFLIMTYNVNSLLVEYRNLPTMTFVIKIGTEQLNQRIIFSGNRGNLQGFWLSCFCAKASSNILGKLKLFTLTCCLKPISRTVTNARDPSPLVCG